MYCITKDMREWMQKNDISEADYEFEELLSKYLLFKFKEDLKNE
jgi:hypothetical protein